MTERPRRGVARLVGAVVDSVDVDTVLSGIDVDALLARVDIEDLLQRIDIDALIARVDVDTLVAKVDVDGIVARVDLDALMQRVDVAALMDRVDVDAVVARVDLDRLLERIDMNALLDRVDIDRLMARIDIAALLDRASVGSVVTDSAGAVATSALDLARRQLAALDVVVCGVFDRLFRRPRPSADRVAHIDRRPAGPVSRLVAYLLDAAAAAGLFGLTVSTFTYLANLVVSTDFRPTRDGGGVWLALATAFTLFYFWVGAVVAGRTPGKALVGLRIVDVSNEPIGPLRALLRTVVFPLGFVFGIGFVGIAIGRNRRGLHDLAGRSLVLYDWGERTAELPEPLRRFLEQRAAA